MRSIKGAILAVILRTLFYNRGKTKEVFFETISGIKLVKKEIKSMYHDLLKQVEKELGLSKEIWLWKPWYARILSFFSIPIPLSKREELFFVSTFSLLAKLSKADGRLSRSEIDKVGLFMSRSLRLNFEQKKIAIAVFRKAKESSNTFENSAYSFYKLYKKNPIMLENIILLMLSLAYADGDFSTEEEKLIKSAAKVFKLTEKEYELIKVLYLKNRYFDNSSSKTKEKEYYSKNYKKKFKKRKTSRQRSYNQSYNHEPFNIDSYQILGCKRGDSKKQIKKKYRKLVMKYHPDRLVAKGLPKEMITEAEKKFLQIQGAFEEVMRDYR